MGLTITEKILAAHAGKDKVTPGETIWVDVDVLMKYIQRTVWGKCKSV